MATYDFQQRSETHWASFDSSEGKCACKSYFCFMLFSLSVTVLCKFFYSYKNFNRISIPFYSLFLYKNSISEFSENLRWNAIFERQANEDWRPWVPLILWILFSDEVVSWWTTTTANNFVEKSMYFCNKRIVTNLTDLW